MNEIVIAPQQYCEGQLRQSIYRASKCWHIKRAQEDVAILLLLLGLTCAQLTWVIISHLRGRGRTKAETYSPCVNWAVCPSPKLLQGTCGLCWRLKSPLGQQSELQPQLGFSPIMESVKTWGGRYCSDHYNGGFCQTHVENQGALRWKSLEEGRAWESAPLEPGARKK